MTRRGAPGTRDGWVPAGARPLLCTAPLDPSGGVATAVTAFGLLAGDRPWLRLDVVGDGPQRLELHRHVEELGLTARVTFHGRLPPRPLRSAVHGCGALLLPHHRVVPVDLDGWAPALRGSLACGRPVVVSDPVARGLRLPPDDALVVPAGVPTALAAAVVHLLDSGGARGPLHLTRPASR